MSGVVSHRGRWFVVKIGGELAADRAKLAASVGAAVREFLADGVKVAIVHGGGPQATELTKKLGHEPVTIGGRRVTDAATLDVMKMSLAGQVSVDVASAMRMAKVKALCTTGVSAGLVEAVKRPPKVITGGPKEPVDLGFVGDVTCVDVDAFEMLATSGFVPVLGSLCGDANGGVFNVNADTVATRVAAALKAAKLLLVSNVPGVLADKNDPKTRIPVLTPARAKDGIAKGTIQGGMIPKVEESLAMLQQGIDAVHIVGIDPPGAVLGEASAPGSHGTVFRAR